jgi:hypothetical protein
VVTAVLFRGRFTVNESPQLNVQQISWGSVDICVMCVKMCVYVLCTYCLQCKCKDPIAYLLWQTRSIIEAFWYFQVPWIWAQTVAKFKVSILIPSFQIIVISKTLVFSSNFVC